MQNRDIALIKVFRTIRQRKDYLPILRRDCKVAQSVSALARRVVVHGEIMFSVCNQKRKKTYFGMSKQENENKMCGQAVHYCSILWYALAFDEG